MIWLYIDKLGDLINTSLFFLLAGAAIFALAWVLMRYGSASSRNGGPVMRPRVWLAAILVALVQTGVIAFIVANRAVHLAQGREIVLDVVPVDPRVPAPRRLRDPRLLHHAE